LTTAVISYDATTQGYTLTVNGRTQIFLPTERDSTLSTTQLTVFKKVNGSTTDTLTLTKPGPSGRFTYKYVGGAFWQRTITGNSSIAGSLDAFAYGVTTPDTALPRTGRVDYTVDLIGTETTSGNVYGIVGQGVTQVDFARGSLVTHGTSSAAITGTARFSSEALLSSSANSFAGTFRFDDFGVFQGSLNGQFYGPAAEELGAAFAASETSGRVVVGALIGRGTAVSTTNATVTSPTVNEFYTADAVRLTTTLQGTSGYNNNGETFSGSAVATEAPVVNYDASTSAYTVIAPDRSQYFSGSNSIGSVREELTTTTPQTTPQGYPYPLFANLQYVKSMRWTMATSAADSARYRIENFVFGAATPDAALPRTGGTLGYDIGLTGTLADKNFPNLGNLIGFGQLKADFATGTLTATGQVIAAEDYIMSGRARGQAGGNFSSTAAIASTANSFAGTIAIDGLGAYSGTLNGRFYGPAAEEVGGAFAATDGVGGVMAGTFVGGQNAEVLNTTSPLAGLSKATSLAFNDGQAAIGGPSLGQITGVVYDPGMGGYTLSLRDTYLSGSTVYTVNLGTATRDAANSTAGVDAFAGTVAGRAYTATVLKPDPANPVLALTYTSLATLVATKPDPDRFVDPRMDRHYVAFGVPTPQTQMPFTGSYTYSGIAQGVGLVKGSTYSGGSLVNTNTYYDLSGTFTLAANFATAGFDSRLTLTGKRSMPPAPPPLPPSTRMAPSPAIACRRSPGR
jgi:hypothetical protein